MATRSPNLTAGYIAVLAGVFALAMIVGLSPLARRMDGEAYDAILTAHPPAAKEPHAVVVAIDDRTLGNYGGIRALRRILANALLIVARARPSVVALDVTVPDLGDPAEDDALADAFSRTPNLVLPGNISDPDSGTWEDPHSLFRRLAASVGHVHAAPDPVSRVLPLEIRSNRQRRWALSLETARLYLRQSNITETPRELELGALRIPSQTDGRPLYIRYREGIPQISAAELLEKASTATALAGKAVFIGVTPQTAARDRLMTPLGYMMSGVEIHAQAFETLIGGQYLRPISNTALLAMCLGFAVAAGATFAFFTGWRAYAPGIFLLVAAHTAPSLMFGRGYVVPYLPVVGTAWLSLITAASWQHFIVRRQLRKSEADKARYQQAIHFVTHEMRSPLTAIQGSSELMGRYSLTDEKRKQIAQMINSESKRLARMIQIFLDVERLTDGQMQIRSENFELSDLLAACVDRARSLADRKEIVMCVDGVADASLKGDRELMEYAIYNLLSNAVKYSPEHTTVSVSAKRDGGSLRLAVRDQGMGMDEKELRQIFTKFYRTKKAEASGEAGSGIGLSIVDQIVSHHGGRIEVTSTPGKGSCFTMVLPVHAATLVTP